MPRAVNEGDSVAVALQALAVSLGDDARASRLLALTGLTPDDLRARAAEAEVLVAVLRFLEDHEPDLLAVASAMGKRPEELVAARSALEP
jgi:CO/xanthine dehydrogenase FAD-binding subunit